MPVSSQVQAERISYRYFFHRSFALISQNPKLSLVLLFVAILPLSVLEVAYLQAAHHLLKSQLARFKHPASQSFSSLDDVRRVNVFAALVILLWIFSSPLQISVMSRIYLKDDDQKPLKQALKVSPRLFLNLLVLLLWLLAFGVVYLAVIVYFHHVIGGMVGSLLTATLLLVTLGFYLTYFRLVVGVATTVSILEPDHRGLTALKRAAFLVQGNTAFGALLYLLLGLLHNILLQVLQPKPGYNRVINVSMLLALYICFSVVSLVAASGSVVFYFSCKAYHLEEAEEIEEKATSDLEAFIAPDN